MKLLMTLFFIGGVSLSANANASKGKPVEAALIIPTTIKCTLEKIKPTATKNKIEVSFEVEDGAYNKSRSSLTVGDTSYNFEVGYGFYGTDNAIEHLIAVNVDYTKDNSGDQADNFDCEFPVDKVIYGNFCEREVTHNGKALFNFSCTAQY